MPLKPHIPNYLFLLDHALDQEIGIAFTVSGVPRESFRTRLYTAKKNAADPRYAELIMFSPAAPHENEIWICKKEVEME
jgi:hypothetical protein